MEGIWYRWARVGGMLEHKMRGYIHATVLEARKTQLFSEPEDMALRHAVREAPLLPRSEGQWVAVVGGRH